MPKQSDEAKFIRKAIVKAQQAMPIFDRPPAIYAR
jgi:hypothetical protein